ncbi:MAG: hypothetical protein QFE16_00345 [Pseudomonadota bacterium]|nr:hypothetical protein [Pseudomonadota bacterium]
MTHPSRVAKLAATVLIAATLAACSGPRDTPLPQDISKMEAIKPAMEKLQPEERELVAGYVMRHTIGAAFGKLAGQDIEGIPVGMTIGKAIDEQRSWKADQVLVEAKKKEEEIKLKAAHEAAVKVMRDAVSVVLVNKKIEAEHGYSGIVTDEKFVVTLSYKNNTAKDISGVKGRVTMKDVFGDELSVVQISNDDTIKAGQSATWTGGRSVNTASETTRTGSWQNFPMTSSP